MITWIVLLVIVVIIVYVFARMHKRVNVTAHTHVQASNGTLDASAVAALDHIADKQTRGEPLTPQDYIDRADVRALNIAENDLAPVRGAIVGGIIDDYLTGMALYADDPAAQQVPDRLRGLADTIAHVDAPAATHVLARVLGGARTTAHAHEIGAAKSRAQKRLHEAARTGATKAGAVKAALTDTRVYTSDAQNVHDSQVNKDLRRTLGIIGVNSLTADQRKRAIDEIGRYCAGDTRALTALSRVRPDNAVTALGTTEYDVLAAVWQRAEHPENVNARDSIRSAVKDALADATDNHGNVVCVGGRCARVVGALTQLDFNPQVGQIGSFQMFRNEIIDGAKRVVDDVLASSPQDRQDAWNRGETCPDISARMRDGVTQHVDGYKNRLDPDALKDITDICMAAID